VIVILASVVGLDEFAAVDAVNLLGESGPSEGEVDGFSEIPHGVDEEDPSNSEEESVDVIVTSLSGPVVDGEAKEGGEDESRKNGEDLSELGVGVEDSVATVVSGTTAEDDQTGQLPEGDQTENNGSEDPPLAPSEDVGPTLVGRGSDQEEIDDQHASQRATVSLVGGAVDLGGSLLKLLGRLLGLRSGLVLVLAGRVVNSLIALVEGVLSSEDVGSQRAGGRSVDIGIETSVGVSVGVVGHCDRIDYI
jgi:hypothetical protein